MPSWLPLPAVPYPPPDQHGYWEPVTSTLQWCEEDYYATIYSAEIINTLTNLMYVYCAWKGVSSCRRHGHDRVFEVAYYGYFLVGFGSFMFHTTLKYPWQLVDELNMIYTTCLMGYASLSHNQSTNYRISLALAAILFCAAVTIYYHYVQDPLFHQSVYAAMTIWLVFRSGYLMETNLRPRWRGQKQKKDDVLSSIQQQEAADKRDLEILGTMWILVVWGITVFLSGFALWGVDNEYCGTLRLWRRSVGLPWGILLEGHGWWHLFTGYGAYCYIVWGIHLRHILNGRQDEYVLVWQRLWHLPEIVRTPEVVKGKSAAKVNNMNGKTGEWEGDERPGRE